LAKKQSSVEMFRSHGIGVMTVTAFLQTVAHKPPAVVLPMPEPSKSCHLTERDVLIRYCPSVKTSTRHHVFVSLLQTLMV